MKRILHCTFASLALLCSNAEGASTDDVERWVITEPFRAEQVLAGGERPSDANVLHFLRGAEASGRLDDARARAEFAAVSGGPDAPPRLVAEALLLEGTIALRSGDYALAAKLLGRATAAPAGALDEESRTDAAQTLAVAGILAGKPRQTLAARVRGKVGLATNKLGLVTAPVDIAGRRVTAVVDTGANLCVLSASVAARLGLRVLDGKASVGSATTAVATRIAVADTVRLGTAVFHRVAFLVIDDAQLAPAGERIDAIIGFPVLSVLGRLSFRETGSGATRRRGLSFEPSDRRVVPGNLRFDGFTPTVRVDADGRAVVLALDSGATTTALDKRYADSVGERLAKLARKTVKVGGAGGVEDHAIAVVPRLVVSVAGSRIELADVAIELAATKTEDNDGTLGTDVLWARGGYTIDFGALSFSLAH